MTEENEIFEIRFDLRSKSIPDLEVRLKKLGIPFAFKVWKQTRPWLVGVTDASAVFYTLFRGQALSLDHEFASALKKLQPYQEGILQFQKQTDLSMGVSIEIVFAGSPQEILLSASTFSELPEPCDILFDLNQNKKFRHEASESELEWIDQHEYEYWNTPMRVTFVGPDGEGEMAYDGRTQCLDTAVSEAFANRESRGAAKNSEKQDIQVTILYDLNLLDLALFLEIDTVEKIKKLGSGLTIRFQKDSVFLRHGR
ncbi:MAG: hypothetical protein Q4D98_03930 [Planctomycetia bacterium]|nr:hypothetical protein [Planctomycetia bacterium]